MVADTADGADGVVDSVLAHGRYPDGPRSQPPLAAEGNFNPECAEERLCPAQLLSFAHTNETNIGPLGHAQGVIGLSQRKRRNRAKSPSVEQRAYVPQLTQPHGREPPRCGLDHLPAGPGLLGLTALSRSGASHQLTANYSLARVLGRPLTGAASPLPHFPFEPGPWKGPATSLGKPGRNAPRKLVFRLDPPALTQR